MNTDAGGRAKPERRTKVPRRTKAPWRAKVTRKLLAAVSEVREHLNRVLIAKPPSVFIPVPGQRK